MKKEDIEHLATLARIELKPEEVEGLTTDITKILEYVSEINEIAGEKNEKKVGPLNNVLREDENPHEGEMYTEDLLNAAPERVGRYVKVKKILGEE